MVKPDSSQTSKGGCGGGALLGLGLSGSRYPGCGRHFAMLHFPCLETRRRCGLGRGGNLLCDEFFELHGGLSVVALKLGHAGREAKLKGVMG